VTPVGQRLSAQMRHASPISCPKIAPLGLRERSRLSTLSGRRTRQAGSKWLECSRGHSRRTRPAPYAERPTHPISVMPLAHRSARADSTVTDETALPYPLRLRPFCSGPASPALGALVTAPAWECRSIGGIADGGRPARRGGTTSTPRRASAARASRTSGLRGPRKASASAHGRPAYAFLTSQSAYLGHCAYMYGPSARYSAAARSDIAAEPAGTDRS